VEQTQRWIAPLLAIVVAGLLILGLTQAFAGPSGIVVPTTGSWRLFKSTTTFTSLEGTPVLTNATASGRSHLRLAPGTYWLVVETQQRNCPIADEYKVHPHQWASKPSRFAAHSCSIQ
jgi:hypothetical protein